MEEKKPLATGFTMPVSELNGYSTRRLLTVLLISHRNLAISRRTTNLAIDSMNVWVRDDADGDDATTHIDCKDDSSVISKHKTCIRQR